MSPRSSARPSRRKGVPWSRPARAAALIGFVVLGACSPAAVAPPSTASAASVVSAEPSPDGSAGSSRGLQAGQTDTDWGRIWDELPAEFPRYPGAIPSDEAETGPVSATFALNDVEPRAVAMWMQGELERASFRMEGLNGPLEDGSFVLDSTGTDGCRVQVVATPLGSVTTLTVRYGAACPSP